MVIFGNVRLLVKSVMVLGTAKILCTAIVWSVKMVMSFLMGNV